jgi:hypothetical protein
MSRFLGERMEMSRFLKKILWKPYHKCYSEIYRKEGKWVLLFLELSVKYCEFSTDVLFISFCIHFRRKNSIKVK